jgi:hypothetical protein
MFRRCKIQPSSTTFVAEVDEEKLKKFLEELAVPPEGNLHYGDVPTLMQAEIFYQIILPHWREIVKDFDAPVHAVLDAGADTGHGYRKHYSGMLVVTPEIACEVGCPWCYAKGWFTSTGYDDIRAMATFGSPEMEKFKETLATCILKCVQEVKSLTIVLGGTVDPLLDQSLCDVSWIIEGAIEDAKRAINVESVLSDESSLKHVYTGMSTSYWYFGEPEIYDSVDCVALTVFDEELRKKHPKFANVGTKEYALVLADVVESLSKDKTVFLTFIGPFYPGAELEYAIDNLKTKVAKELRYLILHPHNWPDEYVYAMLESHWDEIIEGLLRLSLYWNPIEAICLDACMVKKFTGVDLCTGAHWRLYIPSLRFESVKPCPRGGKCIV